MISPSPRKRIKRLFLVLCGLASLFLLFTLVEHTRGKAALASWIKAREKAGEPIRTQDLVPPAPPIESNAAPALLVLLEEHPLRELRDPAPPAQRYLTSNHVAVTASLSSWTDFETNKHEWPALGRIWTAQSNHVEGAVDILLSKPTFHIDFNYDNGFFDFTSPSLIGLKGLGSALESASLLALRQRRAADSVRYLRALIVLSKLQSQQPFVINNLVGYALGQFAFRTTWQSIASGQLSTQQIAELAGAWEQFICLPFLLRAFQVERSMTVRDWALMRDDPARVAQRLGELQEISELFGSAAPPDAHNLVIKSVYLPYWKVAWFDQDMVNALKSWDTAIQMGQTVQRAKSWKAAEITASDTDLDLGPFAQPPELATYDQLRFLISGRLVVEMSYVVRRAARAETIAALAQAALFLELHRRSAGAYPEKLEAALPPGVSLIDVMDGQPLRYRRLGDVYLLYSVGDNLQDDGGNPAKLEVERPKTYIWQGADAVWPWPTNVVNLPPS